MALEIAWDHTRHMVTTISDEEAVERFGTADPRAVSFELAFSNPDDVLGDLPADTVSEDVAFPLASARRIQD